jgi:hypothetical protein
MSNAFNPSLHISLQVGFGYGTANPYSGKPKVWAIEMLDQVREPGLDHLGEVEYTVFRNKAEAISALFLLLSTCPIGICGCGIIRLLLPALIRQITEAY